jgi:hypothetical protein
LYILNNNLVYLEKNLNHVLYDILTIIDFSSNNLDFFNSNEYFTLNSELEQFYLNFNRFRIIKTNMLNCFKNLIKFEINFNQLDEIENDSFINLDKIQSISLSNNKLKHLNESLFLNQVRLVYLNLSSNSIEFIQKNLFKNLYNLIDLDMSNNSLKYIENIALRNLNLLENFFINYNLNLTIFNQSLIGLSNIRHLYISYLTLKSNNNSLFILNDLKPIRIKNLTDLIYYRSLNIIYFENNIDCELILNYIQMNLHINLKSDSQFLKFISHCEKILLW